MIKNYLVTYAGTGLEVLFNQLKMSSDHIEFIDPICAIVKLGILEYKLTGTKISIHNNTITIQDASQLQGIIRWFNSDERHQLHQLRAALIYFRGYELGYVESVNSDIDKETLNLLKENGIKGLKKLKITYENSKKAGSMVKNCLDDYIKIMSNTYTKDEYNKELALLEKPTLIVIYNEFMKKWKQEDIDLILKMFDMISRKENMSVKNEIANSIDRLIISKDLEIDTLRPG